MTAFTAVLLYAAWTLLLPVVYAGTIRVPMIVAGRKKADHWERGKPGDDPPVLMRMKNAHLNCVENFPIFAAVVVIAALLGRMPAIDSIAAYVLYARIVQTVAHVAGTSLPLIAIRGAFYAFQVLLTFYMIAKLLRPI